MKAILLKIKMTGPGPHWFVKEAYRLNASIPPSRFAAVGIDCYSFDREDFMCAMSLLLSQKEVEHGRIETWRKWRLFEMGLAVRLFGVVLLWL